MFPSRWKLVTYALVILVGCLIAAPNLFTRQQLAALPDWLPKQQVTLGLDLKGGSHLVLELDAAALSARARSDSLLDRARAALRDARITAPRANRRRGHRPRRRRRSNAPRPSASARLSSRP